MNIQRIPGKLLLSGLLLYICLVYFPLIGSRAASGEDFIKGDSYYYRAMIESLLHDGDLLLANNIAANPLDGQLALGTSGLVPKHPIIMPAVSLPFYALLGDQGLLLFNVVDSMLVMVLIFIINRLIYNDILALITTVIYATSTLFLDYIYNYSSDIFSTVLMLGGLYCILLQKRYSGAALLGLSIFAKTPNAPLAGIILGYAIITTWRDGKAGADSQNGGLHSLWIIATTLCVFLLALVPFAYSNYALFGSPIVTGYQRAAIAGANGHILLDDHTSKFNQPFVQGIIQTLFDTRNGIVPSNPIVLFAAIGIFWIRKSAFKVELSMILLLCLVQLLFFAKYDDWRASHFSNRFLMTFVALSSVFASSLLQYLSERLRTAQPA